MHLQTIINAMVAREPEPYATGTMKEVKGTASQILEVAYDNDMIYKMCSPRSTVAPMKGAVKVVEMGKRSD